MAVDNYTTPAIGGGRRHGRWQLRELLNAIFYVLCGGIPWRYLPPCFPPHHTVHGWFARWRDGGVWESITHHLVLADRERAGRDAIPTAAVINSQSARTSERM